MKKLMYLLVMLLITSCSNYLADEEGGDSIESSKVIPLTVNVRSTSSSVKIEYPLYVYIFNKGGKIVSQHKIGSQDISFKAELSEGDYTLSAFSGLLDNYYSIPEKLDNNSVISLKEGGSCPLPIQYGCSAFHLEKKSELSIHLSYMVTSLQFKFSKIPEDATGVDVRVLPTSSGFTMEGNYTNDTSTSTTTCKHEGEYWIGGPIYTLPSNNAKTTLTLTIKRPSGDETFVYTYNSQLEPARPYRFCGKYKEKISLNGNFEVDGWKDGIDVEFDFSEEGEEESNGNDSQPEIEDGSGNEDKPGGGNESSDEDTPILYCNSLPEAGDFWNDLYVWKSEITSFDETSAILLSKKQWFKILAADGPSLLEEYVESNLTNWRVFTKEEARTFSEEYELNSSVINQKLREHDQDQFYTNSKERYLCDDCNSTFNLSGRISIRAAGAKTEYYMRAVKNVRFKLKP